MKKQTSSDPVEKASRRRWDPDGATHMRDATSPTQLAPRARAVVAPTSPIGAGARRQDDEPRYDRLGQIGEGERGRVERARDRLLLREVAVKVVRAEVAADPVQLELFLWEARVTAYLDHPNIVPVHDLGATDDGAPFFTMKLARGRTLEAAIAEAREGTQPTEPPFQPARRLRLFLQLCDAVAFAHARGVLHRDLKPANVLLGPFGEVLLSNWGLALPLAGARGAALASFLPSGSQAQGAGTPMYAAPEQVRGEELDERSDVYALGAILYELVALRPAVDGGTLGELLDRVERGAVRPLAETAPNVSKALAAVVAKAMAHDRDARYASAGRLAEELETVLDDRTPDAEHAALIKGASRFYFARNPTIARVRLVDVDVWMAAVLGLGLGAGALAANWIGRRGALALLALGVALFVETALRWLRLFRQRGGRER